MDPNYPDKRFTLLQQSTIDDDEEDNPNDPYPTTETDLTAGLSKTGSLRGFLVASFLAVKGNTLIEMVGEEMESGMVLTLKALVLTHVLQSELPLDKRCLSAFNTAEPEVAAAADDDDDDEEDTFVSQFHGSLMVFLTEFLQLKLRSVNKVLLLSCGAGRGSEGAFKGVIPALTDGEEAPTIDAHDLVDAKLFSHILGFLCKQKNEEINKDWFAFAGGCRKLVEAVWDFAPESVKKIGNTAEGDFWSMSALIKAADPVACAGPGGSAEFRSPPTITAVRSQLCTKTVFGDAGVSEMVNQWVQIKDVEEQSKEEEGVLFRGGADGMRVENKGWETGKLLPSVGYEQWMEENR